MRLDPFIREYRPFMDDLVGVLESERTRFYLDTSLLMWLIRVGSAARAEFLDWCRSRPDCSVRIPVWAAHELHRHLIRSTIRTNVSKTVSEMERKLDEFVRLASERADEEACQLSGYSSRQVYISEVEQAFAKMRGLSKVVANVQQMDSVVDDVIAFVNDHMLDTDINSIIRSLGPTGEFRYSHLMPPGYHDKKDENRFGDLVIWEELLEDIRVEAGTEQLNGVLISRDEKTDWVSSAPLIQADDKPPQKSNRDLDLDVTLAHPLLVHEFVRRARGDSLYVVSPSFLASALDYGARRAGRSSTVSSWLAASHRPDLLDRLAGSDLSTVTPADSSLPPQQTTAAPITQGDYTYSSAVALMQLPIATEVKAYLEAPPHDQSSLFQSWWDQLLSETMNPEHFGRLLAELSLMGRTELLTRLPATLEELRKVVSPIVLNGIALGAVAPAYFNGYGEARRQPRKDLGAVALILERDPQLSPAFVVLAEFLKGSDIELPYVPGSGQDKVRFSVDAAEAVGGVRTLRDVRVGNEPVLTDELPEESSRRLSTLLGHERADGCSGQELRGLLSKEFLVPIELLSTEYDRKRFTWLPDAGLVSLDTSSPGGVSATVIDPEDELD